MDYINHKTNVLMHHMHMNDAQKKVLGKAGSWATDFRDHVLFNLPMEKIAKLYCSDNGRPTKELRALTGATILQQMLNVSDNDTCVNYSMNLLWIEALNLESLELKDWSLCPKTLWNFTDKLTKSGLFTEIMDCVTTNLAKTANVQLATQRLDSVHIFSNMAKLSRVRLFRRTIVKFLINLKKNHKEEWRLLDKELSDRYLSEDNTNKDSAYNFFGNAKPGEREHTLKAMGQDIHKLLTMFDGNKTVEAMTSFTLLGRLFAEQCEPEPADDQDDPQDCGKVSIRIKAPTEIPSTSLQNPSDPDATYSGHKGQGYHAQLMETCAQAKDESGETPLNLITHVFVEGADVHDSKALMPAIADAERLGLKPETLLCDTAYGSDSNILDAGDAGVEVVSPAGGSDPEAGKVRLADFEENEKGQIVRCPAGQKPWDQAKTKKGIMTYAFDEAICKNCPNAAKCPAMEITGKAEIKYSRKNMRLSKRRAKEQTAGFKMLYAMRSGIEATNSCLDRLTGLKHSRYRGIDKIRMAVTFKALGLNFVRFTQKFGKTTE
jgi:hypothetical protein